MVHPGILTEVHSMLRVMMKKVAITTLWIMVLRWHFGVRARFEHCAHMHPNDME